MRLTLQAIEAARQRLQEVKGVQPAAPKEISPGVAVKMLGAEIDRLRGLGYTLAAIREILRESGVEVRMFDLWKRNESAKRKRGRSPKTEKKSLEEKGKVMEGDRRETSEGLARVEANDPRRRPSAQGFRERPTSCNF